MNLLILSLYLDNAFKSHILNYVKIKMDKTFFRYTTYIRYNLEEVEEISVMGLFVLAVFLHIP